MLNLNTLNLNLNKYSKPKPTLVFRNCAYVCTYHRVQLSYTTQHRTVLLFFPPILQTTTITQMMSTGGEGKVFAENLLSAITSAKI